MDQAVSNRVRGRDKRSFLPILHHNVVNHDRPEDRHPIHFVNRAEGDASGSF
jgi:hypothetical protein